MEHEVVIESLSHDGRGVTHIEGKTCFVSHALPGERVRIAIQMSKRTYSEAKTVSVITPTESRVEPQCPHYTVCGGCSLQHLSQAQQIELKTKVLLEQLAHFGQAEPKTLLAPLQVDPYGYRRKARLGLKYVQTMDKVLIGFRERSGRYLTDCTTCAVIHPKIAALWEPMRALVQSLSVYREIPQIECAVGDEETALVIRHLQPLTEDDQAKLLDFAAQYQVDLYLQPKGPNTVHQIYPPEGKLRVSYSLPDYQLKLQAHPLDFMQVNAALNQKMIKQALELLEVQPHERVLDLFCGLGNFTLPLARTAQRVVGVEGESTMVERVLENAALNGLTNIEAYCADLTQDSRAAPWAKGKYDKVLIDPARAGADQIIPLIIDLAPEKIVYVSCNPATLARDAGLLCNAGYTLSAAGLMDMFTHTHHTEAMALFTRG